MRAAVVALWLILLAAGFQPAGAQSLMEWAQEFPKTDFSRTIVPFSEIRFDGARRDTIPPIHGPKFQPVFQIRDIGELEPVISVVIGQDARAYPLRIMLWHEIVNDTIGGVPVLVSYCPLCNSGVVFDRRVDDHVLEFGNTGRIRHFDMVMYDHQTESWWQQFTGTAIVGAFAGKVMELVPSRLESLAQFRDRAPEGLVLVPNDPKARPYGTTPYVGMDTRSVPPGLFNYALPDGLKAFDYVVVVGDRAWSLRRLIKEKRIKEDGVVLTWSPGRNSIHDTQTISAGRDLGNVIVRNSDAPHEEVAHDVGFAFAFSAFVPNGRWIRTAR